MNGLDLVAAARNEEQEHGWHWTNESLYPFIYRDQPKGWIYYLTTMEGRSYFYNYSTGRVE